MEPFETPALWETVLKMKSQITEWKKIFSICVTEKDLIYRVYKEHLQLRNKKTKTQLKKKWGKTFEEAICKRTYMNDQ